MSSPLSSRRSRNVSLRPSRHASAFTSGAAPFAVDEHFDRAARHTSRSALPDTASVSSALRAASFLSSPRTQDNAFSKSSKAPRTSARPMTSAAKSQERPHSFTREDRASLEASTAQARNDAIEAKGAIAGFLFSKSSTALPAAPVRTDGGSNASTLSSETPACATNESLVSLSPFDARFEAKSHNASMVVSLSKDAASSGGNACSARFDRGDAASSPRKRQRLETRVSGSASSMNAKVRSAQLAGAAASTAPHDLAVASTPSARVNRRSDACWGSVFASDLATLSTDERDGASKRKKAAAEAHFSLAIATAAATSGALPEFIRASTTSEGSDNASQSFATCWETPLAWYLSFAAFATARAALVETSILVEACSTVSGDAMEATQLHNACTSRSSWSKASSARTAPEHLVSAASCGRRSSRA
mmetsp:Transcript_18876/g.53796  ORF Transcript_18876/g.53796 Transcript_18876/m.53796 type:complete len:422 (+) Transcript_18876:2109-3374(+)